MKTRLTIAALAALILMAPLAHADVLSLNAALFGGGAGGVGLSGAQQDDSFHDGAAGGAYGALVGLEFLLVDGWVEHTQYRNGDGLAGTWTQFMIGIDATIDVGTKKGMAAPDAGEQKGKGGYSSAFLELGMATGFGVGTGQQVDPPLDYKQVTDRGFLVQASAFIAYRMNSAMALGLRVPLQYGYMFKKGLANDTDNHYQSL